MGMVYILILPICLSLAARFVAGSFFLGAFALSPYLALREHRAVAGGSKNVTGRLQWG